jgi:hypothetical protein
MQEIEVLKQAADAALLALDKTAHQLADQKTALEAEYRQLAAELDQAQALRIAASERDYAARVALLEKRENAVRDVQAVASDRLAKIKTLEESVAELNRQRREAEDKMRAAVKEKQRLEGVCADLLIEKKKREAEVSA